MYCPNCGKLNPQEDKFCMYCGAELIDNQNFPEPAPGPGPNAQAVWTGVRGGCGKGWAWLKGHPLVVLPVLFVILIILAVNLVGALLFSPKAVAKKYFLAVTQGDTDGIYSCLDLPESDFISREAFQTCYEQVGAPAVEVSNYEVEESRTASRSSYGTDNPLLLLFAPDMSGVSYDDQEESEDGSLVKNYTVTYHVKGDSTTQTMQVQLISDPVLGGLFQSYKVLSDYMELNYTVTVPQGATVTVDDIPLAEGYASTSEGDVYTIPAIFVGSHPIAVSTSLGSLTDQIQPGLDGYSGYTCYNIPYSDTTTAALFEQAKTQLSEIITAALSQQPLPSDIALTTDSYDLEDLTDTYLRLQDNLYDTDRGTGYTAFQITSVSDDSELGQTFSSEEIRYTCALDYDYNYTRRNVTWDDEVEMRNGSSYGSAYLGYVYSNGTWQLSSLSVGY